MIETLLVVLSLAVGWLVGRFVGRPQGADVEGADPEAFEATARALDAAGRERDEARRDLARVEAERGELRGERDRLRDERDTAQRTLAAETARRDEQERARAEELARTEKHFQALASQALRSNNAQFLELAKATLETREKQGTAALDQRKQAIEALVKPLTEKLGEVSKATQELEARREKAYGEIKAQFTQLASSTSALQKSSHALSEALRGSSQARGRWGEMALRNIAELAGMTEHCDFSLQVTDGDGQRPDMVVKLPGEGLIPVDAKAPFADYQRACETSDPAERERLLVAHAQALRARVKELVRKDYAKALDAPVDYVVMFVPADPVLAAAFEKNPDLQVEALRDRVLIATPVTLVALLRTVGVYWDQERIARNAGQALQVAQEFYDRVRVFSEHLAKVGKGLDSSVAAYNRAVGSFESRVLPAGRKLEDVMPDATKRLDDPAAVDKAVREPSAARALFVTGGVEGGAEADADADADAEAEAEAEAGAEPATPPVDVAPTAGVHPAPAADEPSGGESGTLFASPTPSPDPHDPQEPRS